MSVIKFNKDFFERGIDSIYYCFVRSWPLSMSSIPVNYDSGSILKLNVTFRYERYVMENVTRGMRRSGWKGYSDSFDPWLGNYGDFESDYYGFAEKETDDKVEPTHEVNEYGYRKYSKEEFEAVTDNLGITNLGDGAGFL